jgi:ribosomal protein S18 acetylase RimI-like enzyme
MLLDIVREDVFKESRFFRDPNFGRDKAREMFEVWARRGLRDRDWFTACERVDGRIAGFVTARMRDESAGSIELVAVAESFRGRGVGKRTVSAAAAELARRGARRISVVTQGANLGAQRLYCDCGFRVVRCGLWFHLWL